MRYLPLIAVAALSVCLPGCRTIGGAMIDGFVDSLFGIDDDCDLEDDVEIDPEILKRKGIEPESKRHKRLVFEETFNRDFHRDWNEKDDLREAPQVRPDSY